MDSETAVLVLNQKTGVQRLVEAPQLFFPSEDDVVLEVRGGRSNGEVYVGLDDCKIPYCPSSAGTGARP